MNKELFKIPIILGVTGHRDIKIEDYEKLKISIRKIFDSLFSRYASTSFILLSPLADGADRIVAQVALEEKYKDKINIKIPLPFDEELYISTFGKGIFEKDDQTFINQSIKEYEDLKINISNSSDDDFFIIPMEFDKEKYLLSNEDEQKNIKRKQYTRLGEYIAIHSNILISLEDKFSLGKEGGTSEITNKKIQGNYEFFTSSNTLFQPEKGLVYRINTPRIKSKIELENKYEITKIFVNNDKVIEEKWNEKEKELNLTLEDYKNYLFTKPCLNISQSKKFNEFRKHHYHINCLNKEIENLDEKNLNKSINKDIQDFKEKLFLQDTYVENNLLKRNLILRRVISSVNRIFDSKVKRMENYILILLMLTTAIITLKSSLPLKLQEITNIIYPVIILGFYVLLIYFNKYKNIAEDTRALSEGLRVQTIWNKLGINESVAFSYLSRQKDELNWIRSTLRTLNIFQIPSNKYELNQDVKDSINKVWIDEQINYFKKKIAEYKKIEAKYAKSIKYLVYVFSIVVLISGIIDTFDLVNNDIFYKITNIIVAIVLILLARLKAKQMFDGFDKIIRQYEVSLENFERAKLLLTNEKLSQIEQINIYKQLGKDALYENTFWTILRRDKNYKTPSL